MGDDAELAAKRGLRDVANVGPVDRYPAVCRVVKAGEQLRDRGLAGARVADESDGRAGGDVEIDPVEDLVAAAVPEPDMLEADMALDPRQVACSLGVAHLRLLVEHGHDLVQRGRGREERVVELRELLDRVEEVLHVEHEGEQRSEGDVALEIEVAAVAEHDGERDRGEQVDEREVEAVEDDRLHVRVAIALGDRAEVVHARALAGEGVDDAHPGDVLGEGGRHEAEPLAHGAVGA